MFANGCGSCCCYFSLLTSVHDLYVTLLLGLIPLTLPLVSHRKFRPSICAPITISLLKSLGRNWPQSSFFPVELIPSRPEFSAHSSTSDAHPPEKKAAAAMQLCGTVLSFCFNQRAHLQLLLENCAFVFVPNRLGKLQLGCRAAHRVAHQFFENVANFVVVLGRTFDVTTAPVLPNQRGDVF